MADHLVLLHEGSLVAVPQIFHSKCTVIYPSVSLPEGVNYTPEEKGFAVLMAGNMRKEKNPELAMAASAMISPSIGFHVYGESSESGSGRVIEHGVVSHDEIITAMSKAQLLLNTSHQEGGSNSICEAISMGLPVIASDIPGNSGMLGDDYAGLFPPNDLEALVLILGKAATEQEFYAQLKKQISDRAPLFSFAREAAAWRSLLESIIN